jgi:hypothetical protein
MRLALLLLAFAAFPPGRPAVGAEGDRPYTPTRLEWLVSYAMPLCNAGLDPRMGMYILVIAGAQGPKAKERDARNTLLIVGKRTPGYNDDAMSRESRPMVRKMRELSLEECEATLRAQAKARGWKWLRVEKELRVEG